MGKHNSPLDFLFQQGKNAELAQKFEAALAAYQKLHNLAPDYPNLNFRLGLIAQHQKQWQQAKIYYEAELNYRPDFWSCRSNFGMVLLQLNQPEQAVRHFTKALSTCTHHEAQLEIRLYLAEALTTCHRYAEALNCYLNLAAQTQKPLYFWRAGSQARLMGDLNRAFALYQKSIQLDPKQDWPHFELARLYSATQNQTQASRHFETFIALNQNTPQRQAIAYTHWAHILVDQGDYKRAQTHLHQALKLHPSDGLRLSQAALFPPVYANEAQIKDQRAQFEFQLTQLSQRQLIIADPLSEIGTLPFYLAYQGYNERDYLMRWSDLFRAFLPQFSLNLSPQNGSKPRLGLVSHFFHDHGITRTFIELFVQLDAYFELVFISLNPLLEDALTTRLKEKADTWLDLQGKLESQLETILAQKLDALMFMDLGIDLHSYILAHYRLAPVQFALPGHPMTSGISTVDVYFSPDSDEPPNADEHYSETLVRLKNGPAFNQRPWLPKVQKTRSELGLTDAPLYLCAATIYKLHPRFDLVFQHLLATDPIGQIIILTPPPNPATALLKQRILKPLSDQEKKRIHFITWLKGPDFMQLLGVVDVLLETFPFGSYNTLLQAFSIGTPVVTWPGEFVRGRYCLGLYRQMGLGFGIATGIADYVEKAICLANDPIWHQEFKSRILTQNRVIFDTYTGVDEFAQRLIYLLKN